MGLIKSEIFSESQNELASIAKVFANPARIAILQYLFNTDSCICGDLVDEIGLAQPTVSQHLKELRNMGLIKGEVEGRNVCYCIDADNWSAMKAKFMPFLDLEPKQMDGNC
ncbi:ArsR/SmtB family transcription factor [Zobellia alginiliquefaciens]|uniref:ArsR/SmtB family transcription factor n=1 Tax=Zobellia alginiliquefaciens TaxID=3032586 RepID=UPI0023E3648E|nr:metalloregulator ArsR/SmtB family transcription factor [Zobellia alginiliquefaciens]